MARRANLLLAQTSGLKTRARLLNIAARPEPTRRQLLMKRTGVPKRMPTKYHNKKGRQFFLTLKGKYVLRQNGKSLYGRKSTDTSAPLAIRPKKRRVV
jgi:hypothetical protein